MLLISTSGQCNGMHAYVPELYKTGVNTRPMHIEIGTQQDAENSAHHFWHYHMRLLRALFILHCASLPSESEPVQCVPLVHTYV